MLTRIIPMNDQKTFTAAGQLQGFDLSKIPVMMEGKHVHPLAFMLDGTLQLIQAATTGVAIAGRDVPALFSDISLTRKPGKQLPLKLDGTSNRHLNAVKNGGSEVEILPANIAANGTGAAITNAVKLRQLLSFWRPKALDPLIELWPAGAYRKGRIDLTVENPATKFDATITLSAVVNSTMDLYVLAVLLDEPWVGIDVRRYYLDDASTSGSTIEMPQGDFAHILLSGWKWANGGGETVTNVTAIDGSTFLPTALPNVSGDVYRHRWFADWLDNAADNVVAGREYGTGTGSASAAAPQCVPVQYVSKFGKYTSGCLRTAAPWKLKTTISSAYTNRPRYVVEEVMDRDLEEITEIGKAHGIPASKLTNVFAVADGRGVQEDRTKFVPMKLYDRPVKPEMRGVRANQARVGGA
jgi:hypothetical protein